VWPLTALNPDSLAILPVSPIISAVVVTALAQGRREVGVLLAPLVRWRVEPVWYFVAFFGPLIFIGAAAGVVTGLVGTSGVLPTVGDWASLPLIFLTTLFVKGPLFEEIGWRGFALPRMQQRWTPLVASLVLGLAWGVWHLPLLISDPSGQRPLVPFVIWTVAVSVILTWLYNRTDGNVLLVTIFHAAMNSWASFILPVFAGDRYLLTWWVLVATTAATAVGLLWRTRGLLGLPQWQSSELAGYHDAPRLPERS
jgi:hypothetical protein